MYCPISFLVLDECLFEPTVRYLLHIDESKELFSTTTVCTLRLIVDVYLKATNVESEAGSLTFRCFKCLFATI